MFRSWRMQLREAEDAFRSGRLDEAERLISGGDLLQYRPGKQLAAEVAEKLAQRAKRQRPELAAEIAAITADYVALRYGRAEDTSGTARLRLRIRRFRP